MQVPFLDLEAQTRTIRDKIDEALSHVIDDTDFILGQPVTKLEERIARYCGVNFAAGVASGTDALLLSLRACGVGPGGEVAIFLIELEVDIRVVTREGRGWFEYAD